MIMYHRFKAILYIYFVINIITTQCEAKGGRGGFSSRGGGFSRSRPSGSSGWSFSKPAPAPSYRPAPSYKPAPAPSYGWNVNRGNTHVNTNQPSYGWNVGNTQTAPKPGSQNIGWNTGNSPVGPPPAYPGLQNRPVPGNNAPPAYSPSYHNPPAYNPTYSNPSYNRPAFNPSYSKPSYHTGSGYYGGSSYNSYPNYGSTFGSSGLPSNTYIYNNYYGSPRSSGFGGSNFLTNALFYGAGMHSGYMWGSHNSYRRRWDEEEDRKWRATTKAPYFENKVPGSETILPAAAVVGAATAFGLVSLLPLNVPAHKPLLYCNASEIAQSQIKFEETTYQCVNGSIAMSCLKKLENETIFDDCKGQTMLCDIKDDLKNLYCTNGTMLSRNNIFCNSTTLLNGTSVNETTTVLNCYEGAVPQAQAAYIPTTTTEAPITTTTEKSLSFSAKVQVFLLRLVGKSKVLETTTTTTTPVPDIPQASLDQAASAWVPEALTIPPETTTESTTTTTTTEEPFEWRMKMPHTFDNGTFGITLAPVPQALLDIQKMGERWGVTMDPTIYVKVPLSNTTTEEYKETSSIAPE